MMNVLIIGNSQTAWNNLPVMVQRLLKLNAHQSTMRVDSVIKMGADLMNLWEIGSSKPSPRFKISSNKCDFVVIQEAYDTSKKQFYEYATKFHNLIQASNAKTILFSTASINCLYPMGFHKLHNFNVELAKKLGVLVADGGYTWLSYLGHTHPLEKRLDLYSHDKKHPSALGSCLYAYAICIAITKSKPTKGTILSQNDGNINIEDIAWEQFARSNPSIKGTC